MAAFKNICKAADWRRFEHRGASCMNVYNPDLWTERELQ
jgi:hypothetical protein